MMKHLGELLSGLDDILVYGSSERTVTSIENDSRLCRQDSLFVAISGTTTDGHTFIDAAIANGARTIVCEHLPSLQRPDCTYLRTNSARIACARLAHAFYDQPSQSLRIIGVTGTNGKTTISFLLKQMLEFTGEKIGLIGTTGNYIGQDYFPTNYTTPEAPELAGLLAKMRDSGITTVVMEVSSHALSMFRVLGIRFAAALFTNLTHDHLDYHGTMESYALAKKKLFDALPTDAIAVLNNDSEYAQFLASDTHSTVVFVGRTSLSHYSITSEDITSSTSVYSLNEIVITTPLVGRFNIDNSAACCAILLASGYDGLTVQSAAKNAVGAPGRMERYSLPNGATAIIDYAHTPDALEKALQTCREILPENGNLCVVFGCGGDRDTSKRSVMGSISEQYADTVYLTNDNPRTESPEKIIEDIRSGMRTSAAVVTITDRAAAIDTAITHSSIGDIILIAGKGHETYQIVGTEKRYCSDKDEVMKYLK